MSRDKVKIFEHQDINKLEQEVNEFLEKNDIEVLDVRFSDSSQSYNGGCKVLIQYIEYEENECEDDASMQELKKEIEEDIDTENEYLKGTKKDISQQDYHVGILDGLSMVLSKINLNFIKDGEYHDV